MSRDRELEAINAWIAKHPVRRCEPGESGLPPPDTSRQIAGGLAAQAKRKHPGGRPPKLTRAQALAAVAKHGSQRQAAIALGVQASTLAAALKRNA